MKKQIVSTLMMAVFTLVFLLSAGMLLAYYGEGVRQQQAFRALERITEQANNHDGENSKTAAVQTEQSAKEKAALHRSFLYFLFRWILADLHDLLPRGKRHANFLLFG